MGGQLSFPGYQRKVTMIKKPSIMCMVAEAAGINWVMGGPGYKPSKVVTDGEANWLVGLAGRHGKGPNRRHGWANIAFFDGHVTLTATYPLSTYTDASGQGGALVIPQSILASPFFCRSCSINCANSRSSIASSRWRLT